MTTLRAMILGAALVAGSVATASAADLYGGSIKDGYMPAPVQGPASWYVRADIGRGHHDTPTMIEEGRFQLTGAHFDDAWTLGGGIGYYFTKNVRADLTWDHRFEADLHGNIPGGNLGLTPFPGAHRFGMKSDVFLANLYYDIDLRSRFTPYVGLGLGFAHNKTTNGTVTDTCGCDFTNVTIAGASQRSVAGALMGGFSFAMRDRLHLDAGYRYLSLGEAHTGLITGTQFASTPAPAPGTAGDPVVRDLWAHEFRVGLRYDIR